jgi:phage terminase large subunit GpA-like protein
MASRDPFDEGWAQGWQPEPDLTVSAWADEYRFLSPKASAEPGHWSTARTPYLRELMDSLSPSHPAQKSVLMKGAQIGGTECGNNWLGYIMHLNPGPALMVQPTLEMAKKVSKQRLAPMIEATPVLRERVSEPRAKDSGNTIFTKDFPGGVLLMAGANSASGLRSMPVRFLFEDEVDAYPGDVGGEGDPLAIAEKRTATFARRKIYLVGTPTVRGVSRIEQEWLKTDRRRYFLPCPRCGHFDWLQWSAGGWRGGEGIHHHIVFEHHDPATAAMQCSGCGAIVEERWKTEMLARGEWRPTAEPQEARTVGFHVSSLYSPLGWKSWAECVAEFLDAKDDVFKLKVWVNTVLGETFEEEGDAVEADTLEARREVYPAEVPDGVGVLVAAVDVQGDRLEAQVTGFGAREESWLIAWQQFPGDPETASLWWDLDRFLRQSFTHQSGRKLRIRCTAIDSGGHHSEQVYRYCKARVGRRVFAIRGGNERGKPVVDRPTRNNRYHTPLYTLCVDTAKETIYSRLKIGRPGPGYLHLPEWVDSEYVAQLTAEKKIRKYVKGRGSVPEWVKLRERNEALDLTVYCLAALYILGPVVLRSLPEWAARLARPVEKSMAPAAGTERATRAALTRRRRRGFVHSWKSY